MTQARHPLNANMRLSHYRVVAALGAGAMGEVYLAEDIRLKRSVAIKVLPPSLRMSRRSRRHFTSRPFCAVTSATS